MKVYLAMPLRLNRNQGLANILYQLLNDLRCEILSGWVLWDDPNQGLDPNGIYKRDNNAISSCDVLIAEVSEPSIGVGMEIMLAKSLGKKVICISKRKYISNFLIGLPGIDLLFYDTQPELREKLSKTLMALGSN